MTELEMEDIDSFRQRARAFVQANLGPSMSGTPADILRNNRTDDEELAGVAREREVQKMLFDAGLAGLCFPREYGGQGLTRTHQRVLNEELEGYEFPSRFQAPTISPCAAVLLDFGTEEQKRRHIPAILKGEELWMQFLSEPSGGSDVAGALTSAVRDGEEWVLNGSKIWTTGAWWSDWGLCLARTNWDVPKHRGLSVFIFPIRQPNIEVHRIEMLNGSREFCQDSSPTSECPTQTGSAPSTMAGPWAPVGCFTNACSPTPPWSLSPWDTGMVATQSPLRSEWRRARQVGSLTLPRGT
jgi:alkylation response protein AidB-like acyl-CoA dehydrogenase